MQYTIRNIPKSLDNELRRRARLEGRSLNEVTLEALTRALGLGAAAIAHRDLGDVAGHWHDDSELEGALADQRRIDESLWK